MRAALQLGLAGLATSFLGFLAGLHVHFPSDAALERLRWEIQDRSKGEWGLTASDLDLYWLSGVSLQDATLYKVKKSRFRRRDDDAAAPQASPFLSADALVARLQLLPALRGGTMVDFDADLYGGQIEGEAGAVGEIQRFAAEGRRIDLSRIPLSGEEWSADLTGNLNLDADITINREQIKDSAGNLRITIEQLSLKGGEFSGFRFDPKDFDNKPMEFTEAVLAFEVENGVAKVTEGRFLSNLVEATVSGDISLNKDFRRWRLRLNVVVTLDESLDKFARIALADARGEDGSYHFMMAGTPGLARLRPDRLGARGGAGAGLRGPRLPGGPDDEGMEPMDRPDMDEGDEGGDEELSADERRQRRLERIRKARERRKQREAERGENGPEPGPGRMPPFPRGGPLGGDEMDPGQGPRMPGWEDEGPMMQGEDDLPMGMPEDGMMQDEGYDPGMPEEQFQER